jgi:phosphate transport system permease protein
MEAVLFIEWLLIAAAMLALPWRKLASLAATSGQRPHSLAHYHGIYALAKWLAASLALWLLWALMSPLWLHDLAQRLVNTASIEEAPDRIIAVQQLLLVAEHRISVLPDAAPWLSRLATTLETAYGNAMLWLGTLQIILGGTILYLALASTTIDYPARRKTEDLFKWMLRLSAGLAILITLLILGTVLWEALRFFEKVPFWEFLFGLEWNPQTAIHAGQSAGEGSFGAIPLFTGTLLITLVAMAVAAPLGLMSAIFMSEYATPSIRRIAKPVLEILAGIPTVVYGYFAAIALAPALRGVGESLGLDVSSESALAAGLVMGIMIIPFVSSLTDDVLHAVPQALRDGAYALGSTRSEMIRQVLVPAAIPGISGALLLAVSRAVGETMIVVMAAGLAANLTFNPLSSVTTVTAQMVSLLVGDQEFDSAKTLAAYALGLVLFLLTLSFNIYALKLVKKYRHGY